MIQRGAHSGSSGVGAAVQTGCARRWWCRGARVQAGCSHAGGVPKIPDKPGCQRRRKAEGPPSAAAAGQAEMATRIGCVSSELKDAPFPTLSWLCVATVAQVRSGGVVFCRAGWMDAAKRDVSGGAGWMDAAGRDGSGGMGWMGPESGQRNCAAPCSDVECRHPLADQPVALGWY